MEKLCGEPEVGPKVPTSAGVFVWTVDHSIQNVTF